MNLDDLDAPLDVRLADTIKQAMYSYYRSRPRNLQKRIGPSQIGDPCDRKIAMMVMQEEKLSQAGDMLPSFVGTAAHAAMEEVCAAWNAKTGRQVWITEQEVTHGGITGTSDAYNTEFRAVVDWKFLGQEGMRNARKGEVAEHYEVQIQQYGAGWENLGFAVDWVALALIPRGGLLGGKYGMIVVPFEYNRAIADAATNRVAKITQDAVTIDVENHPERYEFFATADSCRYCPFHMKGSDIGRQCPGHKEAE